ncbi:MAG: type II toxin-antitoxin system VapC family toxin [Sporichthyaceae bacterium]
MRHYLDTSAAAKLLVEETESTPLKDHLDGLPDADEVMSGALLETELRRIAVRLELDQATVSEVLNRVDLVDLSRAEFRTAGVLPGPSLRSLDALHVAMALRIGADVLVAYDQRLIAAAQSLGLDVVSPGI